MLWSLVRPDRILPPITRSAAVTTSLEAGELAVVMITCGGRNRGRMTHDGQRCERILRRPPPPCHWFSWAMLSNFPCGRDHCRDLGAPAAKRVCRGGGGGPREPPKAPAEPERVPPLPDPTVVPPRNQ